MEFQLDLPSVTPPSQQQPEDIIQLILVSLILTPLKSMWHYKVDFNIFIMTILLMSFKNIFQMNITVLPDFVAWFLLNHFEKILLFSSSNISYSLLLSCLSWDSKDHIFFMSIFCFYLPSSYFYKWYGMNCVSHRFICLSPNLQYSRMWLYLKIWSLQRCLCLNGCSLR